MYIVQKTTFYTTLQYVLFRSKASMDFDLSTGSEYEPSSSSDSDSDGSTVFTDTETDSVHSVDSVDEKPIQMNNVLDKEVLNITPIVFKINGKEVDPFDDCYQPAVIINKLNVVTVQEITKEESVNISNYTCEQLKTAELLGLHAPDLYADELNEPLNVAKLGFLTGRNSRTTKLFNLKKDITKVIEKAIKMSAKNYTVVSQNGHTLAESGVFREEMEDLGDFLISEGNALKRKAHVMVENVAERPKKISANKNHCRSQRALRDESKFKHLCPTCGHKYRTPGELQNHMASHTDIFFKCQVCGKVCGSTKSLYQHGRIHTEGPFTCDICKKTFPYKSSLSNHARVHTGEFNTCGNCGKMYYSYGMYLRHVATCS